MAQMGRFLIDLGTKILVCYYTTCIRFSGTIAVDQIWLLNNQFRRQIFVFLNIE